MAKLKPRIEEFIPDPRLVDERGPTREQIKRLRQSPINAAVEAQKLTRDQGLAAEKFYKHWHNGGMVGRISSIELDRVFGGEGFSVMPRTETEAFHRDRYRKAKLLIEQNDGQISFWVLEQIVCYERSFTEVGGLLGHKGKGKAPQVAYDFLVKPLNRLCREWGLT